MEREREKTKSRELADETIGISSCMALYVCRNTSLLSNHGNYTQSQTELNKKKTEWEERKQFNRCWGGFT